LNGDLIMRAKRRIEIFSAGCATCDEAVAMVKRVACSSCDVEVLDMRSASAAAALSAAGFEEVFVLRGGMEKWNKAGYPVERS
jgi:hypothetical protein